MGPCSSKSKEEREMEKLMKMMGNLKGSVDDLIRKTVLNNPTQIKQAQAKLQSLIENTTDPVFKNSLSLFEPNCEWKGTISNPLSSNLVFKVIDYQNSKILIREESKHAPKNEFSKFLCCTLKTTSDDNIVEVEFTSSITDGTMGNVNREMLNDPAFNKIIPSRDGKFVGKLDVMKREITGKFIMKKNGKDVQADFVVMKK